MYSDERRWDFCDALDEHGTSLSHGRQKIRHDVGGYKESYAGETKFIKGSMNGQF